MKENHEIAFGDRLKIFLIMEGVKQINLAKRMGISKVVLNRYLNNKTSPNAIFLQKLSKLYPLININHLLVGQGDLYLKNDPIIRNNLYKNLLWLKGFLDKIKKGEPLSIEQIKKINTLIESQKEYLDNILK